MENLKKKTISGVVWSAIERFSLQGILFTINIIMARLLLPSDYGTIAMLGIFLQISQSFVDSGFTNALIQKKDRTNVDFSTVFYFNISIAIFFYIVLFFTAPLIAEFYHMPLLISVARVVGLTLIINSLFAIHKTKMTIDVDFKTQSKISLIATIISGIVGIYMAYTGYGIWSIVSQSLLNTILSTFLFYYFSNWSPLLIFSTTSFKQLFSFGSKLLISGLIHTIYYNLYSIVIGRKFSSIDLGYYTRAEQLAVFPSANLNAIISRVTFPILSSIQNDDERLRLVYRKYIRLTSFLIFPLMIGLAALAKPIILILLTVKWIGIVALLQILCLDWMFDHLSAINLNLLYVKGRSDLALRLEILKKIIATVILFLSIPFGILGMCWGRVLYSLIATYMNTYYTKALVGLSFTTQIKDVLPYFLLSLVMGCGICLSNYLCENIALQLFVGFLFGGTIYLLLAFVLKLDSLTEMLLIIKK